MGYIDGTPMFIGDRNYDRKINESLIQLRINSDVIDGDDSVFDKTFQFFRKDHNLIESRALSFLSTMIYCSKRICGNDLKKAVRLAERHLSPKR